VRRSRPTAGRRRRVCVTKVCGCGTLDVMDDADAFSRMYERDSERVLLFLARRTLDADVAVELTAETFALALSSWRRLRELTPEQARAWLFTVARRLYGRYLRTADSSLSTPAITGRMSCKPADCRPQSSVALVEI